MISKSFVLFTLLSFNLWSVEQKATSSTLLFDPYDVKNSADLFVVGEFLYWNVGEDDLGYVVRNSGSTSGITHSKIEQIHSPWAPGFRVGLGWKTGHDQWDIYGDYVHIYSHEETESKAPDGGALFPIWQVPFASPLGGYANEAHASWNMLFDMADLELGRTCKVGKWLSIRPFMGLKGGAINQKLHVNYSGGTAVPLGDRDRIVLKNDFWGVGIRLGFDSLWGFGKGFGLYANGAFSALSGHSHLKEFEKLKHAGTVKLNLKSTNDSVICVGELVLGIQWDHLFPRDRYHLGVHAGWEMQLYTNQNQFIRFLSTTSPGAFRQSGATLFLMGATIGFRFDF